jgi:hypothetical protein
MLFLIGNNPIARMLILLVIKYALTVRYMKALLMAMFGRQQIIQLDGKKYLNI